jgi:hypothetical protein
VIKDIKGEFDTLKSEKAKLTSDNILLKSRLDKREEEFKEAILD